MADLIRRFVSNRVGEYEWDDFMGAPFSDARLEQARIECEQILAEFGSRTDDDVVAARLVLIAERLELISLARPTM
jgi:hypothetical protein